LISRTVRVVLPNYNYARFLPICVRTALEQEGVDVQVLIIDDASNDDSQRVATELANNDNRIELRCHPANRGHLKTFNEGLDWAIGAPYAVLISPDDALTPGSLQRACEVFEANPSVGFVYGDAKIFGGEGPLPDINSGPAQSRVWRGLDWFATRCHHGSNCICSPEVVMRSSVLSQAGGFREDLPHSGDFELWMRLALYGDVGYIEGPHQACYRDHDLGMHRRDFNTALADFTEVRKAFDVLFENHGGRIPNFEGLNNVAKRKLSGRALMAACKELDRDPPNTAAAAALQEFAVATCGDVRELPEWRVLIARKILPALDNVRSKRNS